MSEQPFIEWHGGNCPSCEHEIVEYKMRASRDVVNESRAGSLEWRRDQAYPERDWDIVEYRVKQIGDKEMTKDEAIAKLKELQKNGDTEGDHVDADWVLCHFLISLGHHEIVDEWKKIDKWYA